MVATQVNFDIKISMKATLIRSHVFLYGGEHIKPGEKNFRPELFKLEDGKSQFINMTPYYPLMYHAAIPTMNCGKYFTSTGKPVRGYVRPVHKGRIQRIELTSSLFE